MEKLSQTSSKPRDALDGGLNVRQQVLCLPDQVDCGV